jgi:hypothetical protein
MASEVPALAERVPSSKPPTHPPTCTTTSTPDPLPGRSLTAAELANRRWHSEASASGETCVTSVTMCVLPLITLYIGVNMPGMGHTPSLDSTPRNRKAIPG